MRIPRKEVEYVPHKICCRDLADKAKNLAVLAFIASLLHEGGSYSFMVVCILRMKAQVICAHSRKTSVNMSKKS